MEAIVESLAYDLKCNFGLKKKVAYYITQISEKIEVGLMLET